MIRDDLRKDAERLEKEGLQLLRQLPSAAIGRAVHEVLAATLAGTGTPAGWLVLSVAGQVLSEREHVA